MTFREKKPFKNVYKCINVEATCVMFCLVRF